MNNLDFNSFAAGAVTSLLLSKIIHTGVEQFTVTTAQEQAFLTSPIATELIADGIDPKRIWNALSTLDVVVTKLMQQQLRDRVYLSSLVFNTVNFSDNLVISSMKANATAASAPPGLATSAQFVTDLNNLQGFGKFVAHFAQLFLNEANFQLTSKGWKAEPVTNSAIILRNIYPGFLA